MFIWLSTDFNIASLCSRATSTAHVGADPATGIAPDPTPSASLVGVRSPEYHLIEFARGMPEVMIGNALIAEVNWQHPPRRSVDDYIG
jgi:hypothetical protein